MTKREAVEQYEQAKKRLVDATAACEAADNARGVAWRAEIAAHAENEKARDSGAVHYSAPEAGPTWVAEKAAHQTYLACCDAQMTRIGELQLARSWLAVSQALLAEISALEETRR